MDSEIHKLINLVKAAQVNIFFVLTLIAVIWAINFINWIFLGRKLNLLGILPRTPIGLVGIFCSPILHGSFNHMFFNTFPLFVMANLILLGGKEYFFSITMIIVVLSGLMVWIVGRRALHIGASSLIMGYWSFLLFNALITKSGMAIIMGFVSIYYFGGLIMDLFPEDKRTSMEGHISGFLAGIMAIFLESNLAPFTSQIYHSMIQ